MRSATDTWNFSTMLLDESGRCAAYLEEQEYFGLFELCRGLGVVGQEAGEREDELAGGLHLSEVAGGLVELRDEGGVELDDVLLDGTHLLHGVPHQHLRSLLLDLLEDRVVVVHVELVQRQVNLVQDGAIRRAQRVGHSLVHSQVVQHPRLHLLRQQLLLGHLDDLREPRQQRVQQLLHQLLPLLERGLRSDHVPQALVEH